MTKKFKKTSLKLTFEAVQKKIQKMDMWVTFIKEELKIYVRQIIFILICRDKSMNVSKCVILCSYNFCGHKKVVTGI